MQCDSGDPWHVHTIDAPVFLGGDAVAALAVSLTAAEKASTDARACRARQLAEQLLRLPATRRHRPPLTSLLCRQPAPAATVAPFSFFLFCLLISEPTPPSESTTLLSTTKQATKPRIHRTTAAADPGSAIRGPVRG
jgi:hypothetical protein